MKQRILGVVYPICVLMSMLIILLVLYASPAQALCSQTPFEGTWINFGLKPVRISSVTLDFECNDVIYVPVGGTPIPSGPPYKVSIMGKSPIDGKMMDWGKVYGYYTDKNHNEISAIFNLGYTTANVWLSPYTYDYKNKNGVPIHSDRLQVTAHSYNTTTRNVDKTWEVFVRQTRPGSGNVGFNAIWTKTDADRPAVWGWARADFDKKAAEMKAQGYLFESLDAFVLNDGTERYNAVWAKPATKFIPQSPTSPPYNLGEKDRPAVWGWARADFDKKAAEMEAQGYRFQSIDAFVLNDGTERYNAVWMKTNAERPRVWAWTREDFDKKAIVMEALGYQFQSINTFVLKDGMERYNAIWVKTNAERPRVWGWARADFNKKAVEMETQGYKLMNLDAFVLKDGTERYNAIWTKTDVDRPSVWAWTRDDFDLIETEMGIQGYKLISLNAFVPKKST